jgi:hypothetical protein
MINGYGRAIYYTADVSKDGKINYGSWNLHSVSEGMFVKGRRSGKTRTFDCETSTVKTEVKKVRK